MARRSAASAARTYLTDDAEDAKILDFIRALETTGQAAPEQRPMLVSADGTRHELPPAMFDVLRQVASALASGMGVTVAPHNAMLTTQEAADFLGVSRPTVVRLLENGVLPMEKPGRHRFVRLSDLLAHQDAERCRRREVLDAAARAGEADGLYAATDGPPPQTR